MNRFCATFTISAFAFVLCTSLFASGAVAETIKDSALGFEFVVPPGFVRDDSIPAAKPDFVYAFRGPGTEGVDDFIIIERMRGTIGREKIAMPSQLKGRIVQAKWHGFTIDVFEFSEQPNGIECVNFNAQLPVKGRAIQFRVFGSAERKAELHALLDRCLADFKAESNWIASSLPPAVSDSPAYGTVLMVVMASGVILGAVLLWLVRYRSPRGTVLVLALLIYAASFSITTGPSRERRALSGATRMLGFVGLIIGILDVVRHPAKAEAPPLPKD